MRTIDTYGSDQTHDFKVATRLGASWLIGESQIGLGKAAHTGHDPARFDMFLLNVGFNFLFQVLTRFQAEGVE